MECENEEVKRFTYVNICFCQKRLNIFAWKIRYDGSSKEQDKRKCAQKGGAKQI